MAVFALPGPTTGETPLVVTAEVTARASVREANDQAFQDMVSLDHRRLVRLAYVLCGDISQAEDAVADAYARVWPKWASGRVDDLGSYLRRAVVNGVRNRHRHRLVRRRHEERRTPEPAPEAFEEGVADHDLLWSALGRLPEAQRQVVVLRYLDDLSEAETARVLGVPPGTVKSRLARALAGMREAIGDVDR